MPSLRDTLLIFSDLDGSLLDIHTYDWQPAMPWLDKLQDNQDSDHSLQQQNRGRDAGYSAGSGAGRPAVYCRERRGDSA